MSWWQQLIVGGYSIFALVGFLRAWHEIRVKKAPYGVTGIFNLISAFVWGDAIVFGAFWFLAGTATLLLNDWWLFLLFLSAFWLVRSIGEVLYWMNQQFSTVNRVPPETVPFFHFFENDSVWFVYQIYWQCIAVVSLVLTVFTAYRWITSL